MMDTLIGVRVTPEAYGSFQVRGWIGTASMTCTTAHDNAGSLTHWVRPGIEPASSWIPVRFVYIEPWRELLHTVFHRGCTIISERQLKKQKKFFSSWWELLGFSSAPPVLSRPHPVLGFKHVRWGVPVMAQRKQIQLGSMKMQVQSLASLSGLRIQRWHGLKCRSWMWLGSGISVAVV